jgi:hypothetical protein
MASSLNTLGFVLATNITQISREAQRSKELPGGKLVLGWMTESDRRTSLRIFFHYKAVQLAFTEDIVPCGFSVMYW